MIDVSPDEKAKKLPGVKIRDKDTKPEMAIRRLVWSFGFQYRLPDKPIARPA